MTNKTTDYWGLKNLFKFDESQCSVVNDTQEPITIKDREGRDHPLKPGERIVHAGGQRDFSIPSNDKINFSDKSVHEKADFGENFLSITNTLSRNLKDGQIIKGIEFLDFHYKWTKDRKKFILFVKYFILTKSWMTTETKEKFTLYDQALSDWVNEKEFKRKRPVNFILLTILIAIFLIGAIFLCDYREIFVGALIGGLAIQIKEIFDILKDKTTTANKMHMP